MKRFAVVSVAGGIVNNVVAGDDIEMVSSVVGECVEETSQTGTANVGFGWNGSTFVAPPSSGNRFYWDEDTLSWVEVTPAS